MKLGAVDPRTAILLVAVLGVAFFIWKKGGLSGAASALGAGAVNAAGAAASGAAGAIGSAVGLPTPDETTQDPAVARWLLDNFGYWEASKWSSASALFNGAAMGAGTGHAPPAGSPLARHFPSMLPAIDDYSGGIGNVYIAPPSVWAAPSYGGIQGDQGPL